MQTRKWIIGITATLIVALTLAGCGTTSTTTSATATITRGDLVRSVSGSGQVKPIQEINLNFGANGTIAEVRVTEGQKVKKDEVLARLDTTELDQQILQAEASLKSAEASLADLKDGARETDIRTARAQLAAAQAQFDQQSKGNARATDIANAQAQLRSAQSTLDALRHPSAAATSTAQLKVTQASNNLESVRATNAKAKADAELNLQIAANALRDAQDNRSKIYWETHNADGSWKKGPNDRGYQDDIDKYNAAARDEEDAQIKLQQAQVALEQARQKETIDIANAEAQLEDARRQLDALLNPGPDQIAAAEAKVASTTAQLRQLTGGTSNDITISQATVEQRQASLDALLSPPSSADLAKAEANVAQAQANLSQARLNRDRAEIRAPFDGAVAAVNIEQGDSASTAGQSAAIYLVDDSAFYIDVNISEADLAQLRLGLDTQIELDALPGEQLAGTLDYIAPTATVQQNVTTYLARIGLKPTDRPLRAGLSAAVAIVTDQRTNVLLAPNGAIIEGDDGPLVQIKRGDQIQRTPIKVGVAGDVYTEVLSGIQEGDTVIMPGPRPANRGPFG